MIFCEHTLFIHYNFIQYPHYPQDHLKLNLIWLLIYQNINPNISYPLPPIHFLPFFINLKLLLLNNLRIPFPYIPILFLKQNKVLLYKSQSYFLRLLWSLSGDLLLLHLQLVYQPLNHHLLPLLIHHPLHPHKHFILHLENLIYLKHLIHHLLSWFSNLLYKLHILPFLPNNLDAFLARYLKYLPKYNGETGPSIEDHLQAFLDFAENVNIEQENVYMILFVLRYKRCLFNSYLSYINYQPRYDFLFQECTQSKAEI